MYAIASAGVTYRVTKECYMGRIRNCGCKKAMGDSGDDPKWNCDVDVGIGMKISRRVMEDGLLKWDAEALMNRHNSDLGRMVNHNLFSSCRTFIVALKFFSMIYVLISYTENITIRDASLQCKTIQFRPLTQSSDSIMNYGVFLTVICLSPGSKRSPLSSM